MKNLLVASLVATSSLGMAAEEKAHRHCISPKGFYRTHKEENYKYKTSGIGVEYTFYQPQGLNIRLSGLSNLKNENVLVEMENTLFFRFPISKSHNLYPILSSKTSSHKMETIDDKCTFIHKSTGFMGMGWEAIISPLFQIRLEGSLFRDLHNALMVQEDDSFWGKSYSNPHGGRLGLGLTVDLKDHILIELQSYYSKTFKKCYKESGAEVSFKWAF